MDAPLSNVVLDVEDVSLSFTGLSSPVLQHVTLHIAKGEVVGITGQNGSGKTSLCNVICGFIRPSSGFVRLNGRPVSGVARGLSPTHRLNNKAEPCQIRRTFQSHSTIKGLKAWQYVKDKDSEELAALGTHRGLVEAFFVEPLCSIFSRKYRATRQEKCQRCLQQLHGLELDPATAEKDLETLSLGVRRVLEVLRALNTVRTLFVLDEPFTNLRPRTAGLLSQRIRERANAGLAGLVIDHDRVLLREAAHRLYELTPVGLAELGC